MHELYELKDKLMKELEGYSENGKFSKEDVEVIKYLTSAIDHICNIAEAEEEYSNEGGRGGMSYEGGYRYSREGGGNRGGGSRYYREGGRGGNSYARGRGRNANRDSRGRYASASESVSEMAETLGEMMDELPEEVKRDAQKLMQKLEQMM